MANYYIETAANGGNNANIGDITHPWLTLKYGTDNATTSGDVINMGIGIFNEPAQCELAVGVNITGAGKALTIVNCTYYENPRGVDYSYEGYTSDYQDCAIFLNSAEGTDGSQYIKDLTLNGLYGESTPYCGVAIIVRGRGGVSIYNCMIKNFFTGGIALHANGSIFSEPGTRAAGNLIYNNDFINCSNLAGWNSISCTEFSGQEGLRIHDNTYNLTHRPSGYNGDYFTGGYYSRDVKIYNNNFTRLEHEKANGGWWSFGMELFDTQGGFEIYNNTFYGGECSIDLATNPNGLNGHYKTTYDYSFFIHNNFFETIQNEYISGSNVGSIIVEDDNKNGVIITRNYFKNPERALELNSNESIPGVSDNDIEFSYNILDNCGFGVGETAYAIKVNYGGNATLNTFNIFNNVIIGDGVTNLSAIYIINNGTINDITIKNNIVMGATNQAWLYAINNDTFDGLIVSNNIIYDNVNSNNATVLGGVASYSNDGGIKSDPLLSNFELSEDSPGIDAGVAVILYEALDYNGNAIADPPDIGVIEYGGTPPAVVLVESVTLSSEGGAISVSVDNGTLQIYAAILPADATNKSVTWSVIPGTGTGSITQTGLYRALTDGTVTIRAIAQDSV